jgi:hypothetical protein
MSYEKAIKWASKRPKGTKQPVLMHTESGLAFFLIIPQMACLCRAA